MSGAEVPRLGSVKARILNKYIQRKTETRIAQARVFAQAAHDLSGSKSLAGFWSTYVNLEYGLDSRERGREDSMRKEYDKIKHLRPTLKISKEHGLEVEGIAW